MMSLSSPSALSATASEFVPASYSLPQEAKEDATAAVVIRQKKTKEMRGPRKRHKKPKGDNCSVSTTITQSQHGDVEEDDALSYLSLEASYPIGIDYYDNDFLDNSFYGTSLSHYNNPTSRANPLLKKRRSMSDLNSHYQIPDHSYSHYDGSGQQYDDLSESPGFSEFNPDFHQGSHTGSQPVLLQDWSVWFDNVVDQFGSSGSPDNQSLSYYFTNPREYTHRRTPSEGSQDSHGQWLDLQQVIQKEGNLTCQNAREIYGETLLQSDITLKITL